MLVRLLCLYLFFHFWGTCEKQTVEQPKADVILINGKIATLENNSEIVEAIAIKADRIMELGSNELIKATIGDHTEVIDLNGAFAIPGFIEGHGHFSSLGKSLMNLDFIQSKSWETIVKQVEEKVKTTPEGEWITGRGWHQEKWNVPLRQSVNGWPYHRLLSEVSPDNPVILYHASGHALIANEKAMVLAGITDVTKNPAGGTIVRSHTGKAIGVFEETGMDLVSQEYYKYVETLSEEAQQATWNKQIELSQEACLQNGITSFQDAGATFEELKNYQKLAAAGELQVRLWTMISSSQENLEAGLKNYPIINEGNNFFTCRAIKSYMDGALGSFGAWLIEPYSDKPDFYGQNVNSIDTITAISELAAKYNLQHCIHAIGDRANREVLNIFDTIFKANPDKKNFRWRIEHAQHIHPDDFSRFKNLGVIASMQAIHCTSDAPFVPKRLGKERAKTASYSWRNLLDIGVRVSNGTDTPVENINPLHNFYASVTRKGIDDDESFYPEQCMTRIEALESLTKTNAYAAFEEKDKGSLAVGKLADITVLSNNLLSCSNSEILETEVLYTIIGGAVKYKK